MTVIYIVFSICTLLGAGSFEVREISYIDTYRNIATGEMHRTGIPASIKLAQAMVESNAGTSILASRANNHFGIKCKVEWSGGKYYYADDDFDENGMLMESCFRSYQSVHASYLDHSEFLTGRERYSSLFKLSKTDYKGWAYGLQRCGYATDPDYAKKLIKKIQQYKLYLLDEEMPLSH